MNHFFVFCPESLAAQTLDVKSHIVFLERQINDITEQEGTEQTRDGMAAAPHAALADSLVRAERTQACFY